MAVVESLVRGEFLGVKIGFLSISDESIASSQQSGIGIYCIRMSNVGRSLFDIGSVVP